MLVCVSSVKGAPGVSSWALLLAAAWPHHADRVLVEADGSGGVAGARYDFPTTPGVADLVSQVRRGRFEAGFSMESTGRLLRPAGKSEESLWVVPAPIASHDAQAAWAALAKPAADAMVADRRLWIADCGRVWAGSPIEVLISTAALNVIVSDDTVPSLVVLQSRIAAIPGPVSLLVIGRNKHTEAELIGFTGADSVVKLPHHRSLAERAGVFAGNARRSRRSRAWQDALRVAHDLASDHGTVPAAVAAPTERPAVTATEPPAPVPQRSGR